MSQAWHVYQDDNDSKLCGGNTYNNDQWIGPPIDNNGTAHANLDYLATLEEEIRGYEKGQLWPYLMNYKIFHCPSDNRYEQFDRGYRTTSIQGMMNGESWNHDPATSPPEGYVEKASQIVSPGDKYVFIENVDPRGWNGGSWIMGNPGGDQPNWIDPIAIFHNDRSTLGFADGHAEKQTWIGDGPNETIEWAHEATACDNPDSFQFNKPVNWNTREGEDVLWLAKGYIPGAH